MSATPNPYKRVPGLGMEVYQYARLYLAADHLMLVGLTAWNESYRRFFFRDIQAFVIRKNQWGIFYSALWLLGFFSFAAIALMLEDVGAVIFWCIAAVFLLGLVMNILRGPTCSCYVKTAVQTTRITPLNRIKRSQRFLEQLKPLIAQAQGSPAPATAAASPAAEATISPGSSSAPSPGP